MNKLSIRSVLTCIATIVALLAISVAPALADHKGETHGRQGAEEENFQEADNSASEENTSTTKERGKPSDDKETSTASDSSQSTTTEGDSSRSSSDGYSASRTTQRDFEPDPEPSQAPPATKGPNACPDYSGSEGGPYDHDNCDVSQGQHGGGGNGKCAGCTGKADDKGPGGQRPGDHNNGYECDNNGGVGKGNPAHSRCPKLPPTLCPSGTDLAGLPVPSTGCDVRVNELCPPGSDMAGQPPGPNGCNQVLGRIDKVCPEDSDLAGRDMTDLKDCVLGTRFQNSTPPGDEPLGAILPFTGSSGVSMFILIGLLLMGAGLASLRLRKSA